MDSLINQLNHLNEWFSVYHGMYCMCKVSHFVLNITKSFCLVFGFKYLKKWKFVKKWPPFEMWSTRRINSLEPMLDRPLRSTINKKHSFKTFESTGRAVGLLITEMSQLSYLCDNSQANQSIDNHMKVKTCDQLNGALIANHLLMLWNKEIIFT